MAESGLERIFKELKLEHAEFERELWIPLGAAIVAIIVAALYGIWG